MKGVAERGLRQDKRERGEGRERKERSGSGTRQQQQPNLELQHLIIYMYQWKVRHILPKTIFHSIYYIILALQKLIQFLTFDRILGGNCQVFRGVGS